MKKTLFFIVSSLFFLTSIFAQEIKFRGLSFGSSPDEAVKLFGQPAQTLTPNNGAHMVGDLLYRYNNISVAGYMAQMELEFKQNKFIDGAYSLDIEQKHNSFGVSDPSKQIDAYTDLQKKLSKVYGKPDKEKDIESTDGYSSDFYNMELEKGSPYRSAWKKNDGGAILLDLSYNDKNNNWAVAILYISPEEVINMKKQIDAEQQNTEGL